MNMAEQLALAVNSQLPPLKSGSLRFWGHWFGRPLENLHRIAHCRAEGEAVVFRFDGNETLTVYKPGDEFEVDRDVFRIRWAQRITWEWFDYGRPQLPENLYREEYVRDGDHIHFTTTASWRTPDPTLSLAYNSAEIL